MLADATNTLYLGIIITTFLACGPSFASADQLAIECARLPRWTTPPPHPQVNQIHVFCGEWQHEVLRGFHARLGGLNPETVARFTITQPANAQGIYGGSWSYRGYPQPEKFSTMFPDTCSMEQVLHSIVYAANHRTRCPAHAPRWAVCGPNGPTSMADNPGLFCASTNGTMFLIAMAKLSSGKINTAFPLR